VVKQRRVDFVLDKFKKKGIDGVRNFGKMSKMNYISITDWASSLLQAYIGASTVRMQATVA
jgi:hypothetical protein